MHEGRGTGATGALHYLQPMPYATGPWHVPPQLPEHPADLCLVQVEDPWRHGWHHVLRYARHGWWFEDGTALSRSLRVLRWAYIADSVERMSEVPWTGELPAESRLFVHRAITDHENVRLLTAYIGDLLARNQWLLGAVERAREVRGDPTDALRAEVRRLKGLLKHEQDVRADQTESYKRHRQSSGERIMQLTAEVAGLQRALLLMRKQLEQQGRKV